MNFEFPTPFEKPSKSPIWNPQVSEQRQNGHQQTWRVPIQFQTNDGAQVADELGGNGKVRQSHEFEGLLVDMLARFVNSPAEEVDREITYALGRACAFLDLDWAGLWRNSAEHANSFKLTHRFPPRTLEGTNGHQLAGIAPAASQATLAVIPLGTESKSLFPWLTAQAARGKTIGFGNVAELPQEAAQDITALSRLGTRSAIAIPFLVEGRVLGAVSFESLKQENPWPSQNGMVWMMPLDFVAEVFAQIISRKLSDERLGDSQVQLNLAAASAGAALWSLDLRTGRIESTAKGLELLRLPPNSELTFETFLAMVHPEDRDRLRQAQDAALASCGELNVEFRVRFGNGDVRWVSTRGRCQKGSDGVPERLMGVSVDATPRKRTEHLLRESEARFRTVADSAPVLIWMSEQDKTCSFFNRPWLEFTGRTLDQELGNGWAEGVHADDLADCLRTYTTAFDARQPFVMQYRLRRHDGLYRWLSDNGVPRYDPQGNFAGYIGSCVDITERKVA